MQFLLYIVLFSTFCTINIGSGSYFLCFHWYLKKKMLFVLSLVLSLKQKFNELINGKSQANRDQRSNLLFLQRYNQSQKFQIKLVKNWQKALQRHWYLLHWIHHNKKNWWLWKYLQCKFFYLLVNYASRYIEEKMEINTWFLMILLMKTKGY